MTSLRTLSFPFIGSLLAVVLLASPALAADTEDECPTWFPDFRCERDARFDGFTNPMTMPYLFEDPFITTNAQFVGIWHDFPKNGALNVGQAGVMALQLRVAITNKLAFIATKDGLVFYDSDTAKVGKFFPTHPNAKKKLIGDEVGFTDVTAGFKYAIVELPEHNFILTPAIRYEIPIGNRDVFQGRGDGVFIPSVSAAWGWEDFHVVANLGGQVAVNTDKDSDSVFYNLHLDYAIHEMFVPFISVNGMSWTRSGDGSTKVQTRIGNVPLKDAQNLLGTGRFEGADYGNLGSTGVTGQDLVTMAWGVRLPLTKNISLGGAYERALEGKRNLFKQRVTFSTMYEF
jgi:hypothetical protein